MLDRLFKRRKISERPIPKIEGAVANIYPNRITGWSFLNLIDAENGNTIDFQTTEIEAYIDGKPVGKTTADVFRKGIKENKNHPTGNCGFEITLDKNFDLLFLQQNIAVFANGVQLPNKFKSIFRLQKEKKDEDNFFFIHIPKTAGTSFRMMMQKVFNKKNVFPNVEELKSNNDNYPNLNVLESKSQEEQNDIKFISGHLPYSSSVIFPAKSKKLIFLRKPLNRAVSELLNLQDTDPKYHDKSLAEIFELNYTKINSLQVRHLANALEKKELTKADLKIAKNNLRKCYFIGITERFDESVQLASNIFGWKFTESRKDKVSKYDNYALLSDELQQKLKTANELDEHLYHYALELFELSIKDPKKHLAKTPRKPINKNVKKITSKKPASQKKIPEKFRKPKILKSHQLIQKETKCSLDSINGGSTKKEKNFTINKPFLNISGWAIDLPNTKTADEVYIAIGTKYFIQATINQERSDVAETLGNNNYINAGFNATSGIKKVENGNYKLSVFILNNEKKSYLKCNTGISLTIKKQKNNQKKSTPLKPQKSGSVKDNSAKPKLGKNNSAKPKLDKNNSAKPKLGKDNSAKPKLGKNNSAKPKLGKNNSIKPTLLNKLEENGNLSKLEWRLNNTKINTNNASGSIKIENKSIIISGWAMDMPRRIPFFKIFIVVDDNKYFAAKSGIKRPDVVEKLKKPKFLESGFRVQIPVDKLGKGYHSIAILAVDQDKKYQVKSNRRAVIEVL